MADKKEVLRLLELAHQARRDLCKLCGMYSGNIHMGGDMSMIDVLTCLFHRTMQVGPDLVQAPERDRFILSKGACTSSWRRRAFSTIRKFAIHMDR